MAIINDGKSRRLGENALSTLLLLIKNKFVAKEYKTGSTSAYKTLSDNDLTDDLKTKYDAAYTHSTAAHAPTDAQANIIEAVKVNGTNVTIDKKTVDIAVPLTSTDIMADKDSHAKAASPKAVHSYVTSAISALAGNALTRKVLQSGEYDESTGVPTVSGEENVLYFVPSDADENNIFNEYMYIDGKFEFIGTTEVDLTGYLKEEDLVEYTTDEINAIWSSVFSS